MRKGFLVDDVRQDMRYAARTLRKQPGFAAAAVATLALGVGATTAIFSVVNAVLINPLPYPDSDALVRIVHSIGGTDQPYFNQAIYVTYADNSQTFQDVGVWTPGTTAIVTGHGEPEEVRTLSATRGVLTALGVRPEIGRWFASSDEAPGAADTVIVNHGYWHRRLGGDRGVLDRVLTIDGRPHRIIGAMPAGFRFDGEPELILPLRINRGALVSGFALLGVARLKPGVTLTEANADAARVLHVWFETFRVNPSVRPRWAPSIRSLKQDVVGDIGRTLWVLMGTITLVLLMACANVANLLLVRAHARQREFAIRAALGARWTRVARQLLVESVMLAVSGGVLGVALAYVGLRVLLTTAPSNVPRLNEVSLEPRALGFAVIVSLTSALVVGLFPIFRAVQPPTNTLDSGRGINLSRERQRSQHALVAMQVAIALLLLVSAALMIRSFQALRRVEPGFTEPHRVLTFSINIPATMVADAERVVRMQQQIADRAGSIPGVESAAFTTRLPMGSDRSSAALAVEGRPDDGRTPANRQVKIISPGMFHTLGTRMIAGRDFRWDELYGARRIAIVSENFARELWKSPDAAIGKRVREYYVVGSPWHEIVGVAADVHDDGADRRPPATIYFPAQPDARIFGLSGYQARRVSVAIRTARAGYETVLAHVRDAVRNVSADLPIAEVRTLDEVYGQSIARTAFTLTMLGIAGTVSLLLGASGLYGVIAYAVSQRRREIGIRLALGAQPREIHALFMRRGMIVAGIGIAAGLGAAAATTRFMQSLLFGITPLDPIAFAAMPVVLAVAALVASYVPSRAAAALDPVETLRAD